MVRLCCLSILRQPFSNISETVGPIEHTFHLESHWDGGMKVCSGGLGHMTKMATMPIYSKNCLKIFFSRFVRPMIVTLVM